MLYIKTLFNKKKRKLYDANSKDILAKRKDYYKTVKAKLQAKVGCSCGQQITKAGMLGHKRSISHEKKLNLMLLQQLPINLIN